MKQTLLALVAACAVAAIADEPAWPENFWEQIAVGRAAAAAKGSVAETSSNELIFLDSFALIWAYSRGIDFRSDKSGMLIFFR